MKFRVSMKDPDTLADAIRDAVTEEIEKLCLPEDEQEAILEVRFEKVSDVCRNWFQYGEYLEVEVDTDAKTCVVVDQ